MAYRELRPRMVEKDPSLLDKYVGWYVSQKIDGWQGLYNGSKLVSKTGKKSFNLPDSWKNTLAILPANIKLAGEIKKSKVSKRHQLQNSPPRKLSPATGNTQAFTYSTCQALRQHSQLDTKAWKK